MRTFIITILCLFIGITTLRAQQIDIPASTASARTQAFEHRHQMRKNSIFKEYPVRNVGPVVMSGRVTDIAVQADNPRIFYVGFASGGVFKTTNSGNTMQPIFDHAGGTLTIGDIAISKADKDILWVGTGEKNSSRSSYAGAGVYKSTDGGKTWNFTGLRGSQHIGRIITHPTNPDIAWVASMGPLYSMNEVRGIYKTTDGGKTWKRTLTPPDSTGVIDLVMDPKNPNKLWATTWQRFRQAWNFKEAGPGSAIYASTDGGETWHKSMKGFPVGKSVGRIGLDVSPTNPNIMYAFLDNQKETKKRKEQKKNELSQADFLKMSRDAFLNLEDDKLNKFLQTNNFPKKYTAENVKEDIKQGKYEPKALSDYLGDANQALFNTSVKGAQLYKSTNGGESWEKINSYKLKNVYFTYGYYFGEVRVSPTDPNVVYILGFPMLKSTDGGKTWKAMAEKQDVHVDYHAMWIDPSDSQHLLLGNDGGLYESHDGGENFIHHNVAPVAQFYNVAVDMERPYNIYGGMQDNGVFMGSSQGSPNDGNHWKRLLGGDGMHVVVNPQNSNIVYTGFQFGNYFRIDRSTDSTTRITPKANIGEDKYRFNWNTPIAISHFNPDILYMGSQHLHRSLDKGKTWATISPDLTKDLPNGNVPYSTITTIAESPLDFGVIWAGTDDGNIQVTRDGGHTWDLVSENLPKRRWVSKVEASHFDPGTAYASLNGYRYDEFKTYLYKTTNYGKTWKSIKGNLPESVANVIVEDPVDPDLLYAGLDHGTYVSFNGGDHWFLVNGIPNVPAYDMVVHPRDYDLIVGTHGRSVYVMDVKPLHEVADHLNQPVLALKTDGVQYSNQWGERSAPYREVYEPKVQWLYWIGDKNVHGQTISITVKDKDGKIVKKLSDSSSYGFNTFNWNLLVKAGKEDKAGTYLSPGTYTITYNINGSSDETTFEVRSNSNNNHAGERVLTSPEEFEKGGF